MSDVKWIKITTGMFDDEKIRLIESMPDSDSIIAIWVKLLCQAGKCNADGYIYLNEDIPYTDEMLSTVFSRPLNTVRLALSVFEKFGMLHKNGQHLIVTNWKKHQNLEALDKIRENARLRQAKHRTVEKGLLQAGNVTGRDTSRDVTALEIDKIRDRQDKEIDKDDPPTPLESSESSFTNIADLIERETAGIIHVTLQAVSRVCRDYTAQWVIDAVRQMVSSYNQEDWKWGIVVGILKNWKEEGHKTL